MIDGVHGRKPTSNDLPMAVNLHVQNFVPWLPVVVLRGSETSASVANYF